MHLCLALAVVVTLAACAPGGTGATRFNGTWTRDGGELKVWALDERRLRVEFRGEYEYESSQGPMVNVGTGAGDAAVEDGAATFRPVDADDDCRISLRPAGERLEVSETGECGFGLNVTAAGTYQRVSAAEPQFESP